MSRCPFAVWNPISGSSGSNLGGPFKIVHHTTEGSSAAGAFSAFRSNRSDPHFTVDGTAIYQHIDTGSAARALRNAAGGVQTNRDSAVQIEIVGFAHRPKTRATLENVRRLCRWIEAEHNVPKVWPNGPPKPARDGNDPGGHNRDAATWNTTSGHYGHSNVPENTHWDPAYLATEVAFLMLESTEGLESSAEFESIITEDPGLADDHSRMPDHDDPNPGQEAAPRRRSKSRSSQSAAGLEAAASSIPAITDALIPRGRIDRPGNAMSATSVTIHNTSNPNRGANAKAHARALASGSLLGEYLRSWHFTVDDKSIYRHVPINERAFHAGKRAGNSTSIGVEICENSDLDPPKAYRNAAWLAAQLLKQIGKTPANGLKQHHDWSGKDCPGVLRHKSGGWTDFVADVMAAYATESPVELRFDSGNRKSSFTSPDPEEAAEKLESALSDPVIRSIIRHEYLHAAGTLRGEADADVLEAPPTSPAADWQPHHMKAQFKLAVKNGWVDAFEEAAAKRGFPVAVLMAIASRETNMRNIIGDGGHGYGLMQIDDRSFADWCKSGAWKEGAQGIAMGALVLDQKRTQIEQGKGKKLKVGNTSFTGANFTDAELLQIAVAAYNSGLRSYMNFSLNGNPDKGTTGHDYSADVMNRSERFKALLASA